MSKSIDFHYFVTFLSAHSKGYKKMKDVFSALAMPSLNSGTGRNTEENSKRRQVLEHKFQWLREVSESKRSPKQRMSPLYTPTLFEEIDSGFILLF